MSNYKCIYFSPEELVGPEVYNSYQNKDEIYDLFDEKLLRIIDMLRGWARVPLTINSWKYGGSRIASGYRDPSSTIGAPKSAHKQGKAVDIISAKLTAQDLWELLKKNQAKLPCKIRIEKTQNGKQISWCHIDTSAKPDQKEKIYFFNA